MLRLQRGRKGEDRGLLCDLHSPLTGCVYKQFVLHFDDDGSHSCTEAATTHGIYGRTVSVKMDGQRVAYLWGDLMGHIKSDGMPEGDFIRPYAFAPIDTTGLLVALSL